MMMRTKMVPAALVEIDAVLLMAAYDYMTTTKAKTVTIQIVNGRAVDVDTETVRSPAPIIAISDAEKHIPPEMLTEDVILGVMRQGNPTAIAIGDALNIPRKDSATRGKISRIIHNLCEEGKIKLVEGTYFQYTICSSASSPENRSSKEKRVTRNMVTRTLVKRAFVDANTPVTSRTISDMLGIARDKSSVRSKTSVIIKSLLDANFIQKDGTDKGQFLYKMVTNA